MTTLELEMVAEAANKQLETNLIWEDLADNEQFTYRSNAERKLGAWCGMATAREIFNQEILPVNFEQTMSKDQIYNFCIGQ